MRGRSGNLAACLVMGGRRDWAVRRRRRAFLLTGAAGALGLSLLTMMVACGTGKPEPGPTPAEFQPGEAKFKANCARCHGERAVGTTQGPPLVHKIYEPNHHGDAAFQLAVANGVRAHHWQFGNMPKIEGLTPADVAEIVKYVRWLQRQAGIH